MYVYLVRPVQLSHDSEMGDVKRFEMVGVKAGVFCEHCGSGAQGSAKKPEVLPLDLAAGINNKQRLHSADAPVVAQSLVPWHSEHRLNAVARYESSAGWHGYAADESDIEVFKVGSELAFYTRLADIGDAALGTALGFNRAYICPGGSRGGNAGASCVK